MRPTFDPYTVHRELEIIRNDLHCNAIKIQGFDVSNIIRTAKDALGDDLFDEVWLAPEMFDQDQEQTLQYTVKAAEQSEKLRSEWSSQTQIVFSVGTELTGFMQGIAEGNNMMERFTNPNFRENWRAGKYVKLLNDYLSKVSKAVREVFNGKITYASLPRIETVDWSLFDYVCIDAYRDRFTKSSYDEWVKRYFKYGKPVVVGEFGCCTYRGAEDLGGMGWDIVDFSKMPPELKGNYVYDQGLQAQELSTQLQILDDVGVHGAFIFTFIQPLDLTNDPGMLKMLQRITFDPDISSYSLVKSYPDGRHGAAYPDMTWEPKLSFRAVADYFAKY